MVVFVEWVMLLSGVSKGSDYARNKPPIDHHPCTDNTEELLQTESGSMMVLNPTH